MPLQMDAMLQRVHDPNLKTTLALGIGLHHAGLVEGDRKLVEELFVNQKIQVLQIMHTSLLYSLNAWPVGVAIVMFGLYVSVPCVFVWD